MNETLPYRIRELQESDAEQLIIYLGKGNCRVSHQRTLFLGPKKQHHEDQSQS